MNRGRQFRLDAVMVQTLWRYRSQGLSIQQAAAWVYWQVLDGGGWGLIQADESADTTGAVNTKYYVVAQCSRHIHQGMRIIDGGEANTTAAHDSLNKRLVLLTTNYGTPQRVAYDLSRFAAAGGTNGIVDRWVTQTIGTGDTYTHHTDTQLARQELLGHFPGQHGPDLPDRQRRDLTRCRE
jgi:galactan endo-1,6-beta-galactosidase